MRKDYMTPGMKMKLTDLLDEINNSTSIGDLYNPEDTESDDGIPMH